jgi:hypothetical protein
MRSRSRDARTPEARELALRESNGVRVVLLRHPREDAVTVSVEDDRGDHRFELAVECERALEALRHPYACAA